MIVYRLSPQADTDIEEIVLYIAHDNQSAAWTWWDSVLDKCRRLGEMPGIGIARPEIRPELRTSTFGSYIIAYREIAGGVEIIRIVHGARRWEELL